MDFLKRLSFVQHFKEDLSFGFRCLISVIVTIINTSLFTIVISIAITISIGIPSMPNCCKSVQCSS